MTGEMDHPTVTAVRAMEPWRHDVDLGPFSTFEVAESTGPYADIGHPKSRYRFARMFLPPPPVTVLDVGCNAGGIAFRLERDGYDVTGVDSGVDPGLNEPNPALFEEGDAEGLWQRDAGPIEQARYCKRVLDSDVTFVRRDAFDYLGDVDEIDHEGASWDVVVAFGILYHVHEGREGSVPRTAWAKRFLDLLMQSADQRVLIETSFEGYEWVGEYLHDEGHLVLASVHPKVAPPGVRHFLAVAPGGGDGE